MAKISYLFTKADKPFKPFLFPDFVYYGLLTIFTVLGGCYWPKYIFLAYSINLIFIFWALDGLIFCIIQFIKSKPGTPERSKFWKEDIDYFIYPIVMWAHLAYPLYLSVFDIWYW